MEPTDKYRDINICDIPKILPYSCLVLIHFHSTVYSVETKACQVSFLLSSLCIRGLNSIDSLYRVHLLWIYIHIRCVSGISCWTGFFLGRLQKPMRFDCRKCTVDRHRIRRSGLTISRWRSSANFTHATVSNSKIRLKRDLFFDRPPIHL